MRERAEWEEEEETPETYLRRTWRRDKGGGPEGRCVEGGAVCSLLQAHVSSFTPWVLSAFACLQWSVRGTVRESQVPSSEVTLEALEPSAVRLLFPWCFCAVSVVLLRRLLLSSVTSLMLSLSLLPLMEMKSRAQSHTACMAVVARGPCSSLAFVTLWAVSLMPHQAIISSYSLSISNQ